MDRYQLATLSSWAGERGIQGRKRLQKVVFLLQAAGCPLSSHFTLHHYGPYSRDVADTWTLKLVLQPFVENALLHGLHVLKDHINLVISVEREENELVWKVIDDGVGMPQDQIPRLNDAESGPSGYGIANVHRRIRMYFGEEYGVTIMSDEGVGTAVMIRMPLMLQKPSE